MNSHSAFDQLVQNMERQCQPSLAEREAERIDRELRKTERADRILRELERADRLSRDLHGETASSMLSKRPFDSLVDSQEVLSRLAQEVLTPRTDLIFSNHSPPAFSDPMKWLNDLRIPVKSMESQLSKLPLPEFPKNHTLAELEQMSDDEIRAVLNGNVSIKTVQLARHVREMRHLEQVMQPHWSLTPTFWWLVASVILTAIGIVVGIVLTAR